MAAITPAHLLPIKLLIVGTAHFRRNDDVSRLLDPARQPSAKQSTSKLNTCLHRAERNGFAMQVSHKNSSALYGQTIIRWLSGTASILWLIPYTLDFAWLGIIQPNRDECSVFNDKASTSPVRLLPQPIPCSNWFTKWKLNSVFKNFYLNICRRSAGGGCRGKPYFEITHMWCEQHITTYRFRWELISNSNSNLNSVSFRFVLFRSPFHTLYGCTVTLQHMIRQAGRLSVGLSNSHSVT